MSYQNLAPWELLILQILADFDMIMKENQFYEDGGSNSSEDNSDGKLVMEEMTAPVPVDRQDLDQSLAKLWALLT